MLMTPEEKERYDRIDRQLEFLAAHQAQLSSDLAELQRVTAEHSRQIAKQGEQIAAQGNQMQSLAESVLRLARIIDERDRQTDAKISALIDHNRQTDAKITALIGVVEEKSGDRLLNLEIRQDSIRAPRGGRNPTPRRPSFLLQHESQTVGQSGTDDANL